MLKQKFIIIKTIFVSLLPLFFIVVHAFILISMPLHAVQAKSHGDQITSESRLCAQQCSANTSEPRLTSKENKDDDNTPTPFKLLLIVISATGAFIYILPVLVKYVRRNIKIPIYKQVACFRI